MTRHQIIITIATWLLLLILIGVAMIRADAASVTDAPTAQYSYIGSYTLTGYVPHLVGRGDGIGASGALIQPGKHIAMHSIPFGTQLYIAGIGWREVQDRGVPTGVVDVACETVGECYQITAHGVPVFIVR